MLRYTCWCAEYYIVFVSVFTTWNISQFVLHEVGAQEQKLMCVISAENGVFCEVTSLANLSTWSLPSSGIMQQYDLSIENVWMGNSANERPFVNMLSTPMLMDNVCPNRMNSTL